MLKKIKLFDVFLVITLIVANLLQGSPLRYNIDVANTLINILAIIYVIRLIFKKQKIVINKIDIFVILLSFSTFIPLITNSYLRLYDTVEYILRYMSALNIYFITRQYLLKDYNKVSIITKVIMYVSIVFIFIGIDMITLNIFSKFYNFLKAPIILVENNNRIDSLFKYANTFGLFISIALLITVSNYLLEKKIYKKALYASFVFLQIFAIIMTYSRLCWLLIAFLLIVYFIIVKDKKRDFLFLLIISFLNAVIYYCMYYIFKDNGNYAFIWIMLAIQGVFEYIIIVKKNVLNSIFEKLKDNKKILMAFLIIAIFIILIMIAIILMPTDIVLFNNDNSKKVYIKDNISVDTNTEYILKVDLESYTNKKDTFVIYLAQFDEYSKKITREMIVFDNYSGIKEIKFKTRENTKKVKLSFKCQNMDKDNLFIVHSVTLNDKKIRMNYNIIPIEFINRFEKINLETSSIKTRLEFMGRSIEIIKNNILFGTGGYGWKNSNINSSLELNSVAEHSYPMQLFIQNGIIAFVLFICILIFVFKSIYKVFREERDNFIKLGIGLSFTMIILHSLLDFDMYFMPILLEMYIFIAILNTSKENKDKVKGRCILKYLYSIVLFILLYFNIGEVISLHLDTRNFEGMNNKLNVINTQIILSPHRYSFYEDKITCLNSIKKINNINADEDIDSEINKAKDFIINVEKNKYKIFYD